MAETLGSLVDKLSIKNIRLSFLKAGNYNTPNAEEKIAVVEQQRHDLIAEIDDFLQKAIRSEVRVKELKVKLYKNPSQIQKGTIAAMICSLSNKNLELWNLEDEVRRTDISDASIVLAKRKIDKANQERNDLIDAIDSSLEEFIKHDFLKVGGIN